MKAKLALVLILVTVVALSAVGCVYKTTGGGFIIDDDTDAKITFGFVANPTDCGGAKGQFQLVDHGTKPPTRVHGTFEWVDLFPSSEQGFWGECYIGKDDGPHTFMAYADDKGEPGLGAGDWVMIVIFNPGGPTVYAGELEGGNIQVHDEED